MKTLHGVLTPLSSDMLLPIISRYVSFQIKCAVESDNTTAAVETGGTVTVTTLEALEEGPLFPSRSAAVLFHDECTAYMNISRV